MLKSLTSSASESIVETDVAVIGAGLAGLVLAARLSRLGLTVVVLESGGEKQHGNTHPLNEVELTGHIYKGATNGRFRTLGGTSTRWGAALLPYLSDDFGAHPCGWHNGWGLDAGELNPFLGNIEQDFSVMAGSYHGGSASEGFLPSFVPRSPKWPVFQKRSASAIYRKQIIADARLRVWINATVTGVNIRDGQITGLVAQSLDGGKLHVKTTHIAITAGAIETTRQLLLFDQANSNQIFPPDSPLGHGFHDHLSASIATLNPTKRSELSRLFGFCFVRGGMRNLRFELAPEVRKAKSLPGAFLHVAFARDSESGFDGLRRIYQSIQNNSQPSFIDVRRVVTDLPWLLHAAWWRFVYRRLLPPYGARFELHLVTEQKPDSNNRISLSNSECDAFGLALPSIHWKVRGDDIDLFSRISDIAKAEWNSGKLSSIATLEPIQANRITREVLDGGGIYHPAGTTRIGSSANCSVVNTQLRVHGVPGLWAISTAAFPSIGGTSPSLGLMQFAVRAAEDIAGSIRRRHGGQPMVNIAT